MASAARPATNAVKAFASIPGIFNGYHRKMITLAIFFEGFEWYVHNIQYFLRAYCDIALNNICLIMREYENTRSDIWAIISLIPDYDHRLKHWWRWTNDDDCRAASLAPCWLLSSGAFLKLKLVCSVWVWAPWGPPKKQSLTSWLGVMIAFMMTWICQPWSHDHVMFIAMIQNIILWTTAVHS